MQNNSDITNKSYQLVYKLYIPEQLTIVSELGSIMLANSPMIVCRSKDTQLFAYINSRIVEYSVSNFDLNNFANTEFFTTPLPLNP